MGGDAGGERPNVVLVAIDGRRADYGGYVSEKRNVTPTLAELAGVVPPDGIDGVSVLPSLVSGSQPDLRKRPLYWESGSRQAARMANWKAVRPAPDGPLELYDLAHDIGEQNDVAADHPVVVAWFKRYLAEARTPSPHWPSPLDSLDSY
jgi:arylsulfatase A-like enzyme